VIDILDILFLVYSSPESALRHPSCLLLIPARPIRLRWGLCSLLLYEAPCTILPWRWLLWYPTLLRLSLRQEISLLLLLEARRGRVKRLRKALLRHTHNAWSATATALYHVHLRHMQLLLFLLPRTSFDLSLHGGRSLVLLGE